MIEALKNLPAIWAVFGMLLAGGIFAYANRHYFSFQAKATENLMSLYERQVSILTAEREDYKQKLHAEKNEHQATKSRLQELEMRPDITLLFETSKSFYDSQAKAQTAQSDLMKQQTELIRETILAVHKHDTDVEKKMKPIYDSLANISQGVIEACNGVKEILKRGLPKPA